MVDDHGQHVLAAWGGRLSESQDPPSPRERACRDERSRSGVERSETGEGAAANGGSFNSI